MKKVGAFMLFLLVFLIVMYERGCSDVADKRNVLRFIEVHKWLSDTSQVSVIKANMWLQHREFVICTPLTNLSPTMRIHLTAVEPEDKIRIRYLLSEFNIETPSNLDDAQIIYEFGTEREGASVSFVGTKSDLYIFSIW